MGLFDGFYRAFNNLIKQTFDKTNFNISPEATNYQEIKSADSITKTFILKFFDINDTKEKLIEQYDDIKTFYFTQLMIDRIIEDALNPQVGQELFSVKVKDSEGEVDETLTELCKEFSKDMNLERIINDVAFDLLLYGEYALRLDVVSFNSGDSYKGIINIHDDVDLTKILPVYRDSDISYFLTLEKVNGRVKLVSKQPTNFAYFVLPGNRVKIKVEGEDEKLLHIRMGKSLIYPVMGLLKELRFLEEIIPQQFINNLIKTKLIGVSVPAKTRPQEAMKIAETYQKLINNTLTDSDINKDDKKLLDELKKKVGNVKVIPDFGDKGGLTEIDFNQENYFDDIFDKIMDIRKNILITVGIPSSIIDEDGSKADTIKDHIRYTKKLKSIQQALKEGLQRMFVIHLTNNGFTSIKKENIEINFLNVLNTDDLEKLEYIDLMISMMDNFKSMIEDMDENPKIKVNYEDYVKFLNSNFEHITGFTLFEYDEEGAKKAEEDDGDDY